MRVLVNEISTWDGAKTGVGYYTSGLITGLSARGDVELAHYPPRWLGWTLASGALVTNSARFTISARNTARPPIG